MTVKDQGMTIGTKLWLLCICLVFNMLLVGGISAWSTKSISKALRDADEVEIPTVRNISLLDMMHDAVRGNVMHAIIVSGSKEAKEIDEVRQETEENVRDLHMYLGELLKLDLEPATKSLISATDAPILAYIKSARSVIDTALAGNVEEALKLMPEFNTKFLDLEGKLAAAQESMKKSIADSKLEDDQKISASETIGIFVLLLGTVVGLTFSWLIIRNLQRTLKEVISGLNVESMSVTDAAHNLNRASENLSNATTMQASALQETAASVDEITAMVKKTSDNSKNLETSAHQSQESAAKGQQSITEMLAAIQNISDSHAHIMNQVEEGNQKITEIVKVIGEIGNKTKVINDIVFQTKLLSFNASVEAARAGEHGKGFAVVAEEVGNLAQMSGNAAKEISDMLGASIAKVEGIVSENKRKVEGLIIDGKTKIEVGATVAKQCGTRLDEIVSNSADVGLMIGEIATAIHEQNQGIHEISKAIQLLDQSTHENSATSTETSSTSRSLLGQSQSLHAIVDRLQEMIGGVPAVAPTTSHRPMTKASAHTPSVTATTSSVAPAKGNRAKVIPIEKNKVGNADRDVSAVSQEMKRAAGSGFALPSENDPRFEDI